ncbi:MAG: metallophosphoesterase family protein, partial [Myxococcota bacterium]
MPGPVFVRPPARSTCPRRLGLIADTHGALLDDAARELERASVDLILHAGDIGGEAVIRALEAIAPVVAVAGNGDEEDYHRYPWDLKLHLGARRVLLCHWYDNFGRLHPRYEGILREWSPEVLVYGHTHESLAEWRGATLFVNPGYAGPLDRSRERTLAILDL